MKQFYFTLIRDFLKKEINIHKSAKKYLKGDRHNDAHSIVQKIKSFIQLIKLLFDIICIEIYTGTKEK